MAIAVWGVLAASPLVAAPADDMKALLEQGKAVEAYQVGHDASEQMGNPLFDFYFGIASLDSGHSGEGVLALERYLLNYPDNRSAHFQLARGYFILGEDQRAKDEFSALQPTASGEEKSAIERYLDAIRARESRYLPTSSAYVEAGFGFDDNINAGINGGSAVSIPGLGAFTIASNGVSAKESDSYSTSAVGGQMTYPVAPGVALFGAVAGDVKQYMKTNNDQFDQLSYGGAGGISYLKGKNLYKLTLGLSQLEVDRQNYVQTTSLNGEWHHQLDDFNRFTLGGQYAQLDYDDTFVYLTKNKVGGKVLNTSSGRSSELYTISGTWTRAFALPYQPLASLTANYGEERNQKGFDNLSRDIWGLKAALSLTPAPKWGLSAGLAYQESQYKAAFAGSGTPSRSDDGWIADAVLSYFYSRELTFRMEAQISSQNSNIPLFQYDRNVLAFKVRYDFK
ncbi:MAG TPA: hypothetical protein VFW68_11410 [Rhodocyclaceae bacterium]|nr:hypothetical protein [Rhodocyclaceae bacterium]